jgi:uncharacterized protein (DUF1684 family)
MWDGTARSRSCHSPARTAFGSALAGSSRVFLPFADRTNGNESYAGGRYLLDTIKGADLGRADDRVILDFNFAYNPSCAYSDRWTCPLSPPSNRLQSAVGAGECRPE